MGGHDRRQVLAELLLAGDDLAGWGSSGVGPKRRKALLKAFGSVKKIRQANVETIAAVPGINLSLAETIKSLL